MLARQSARVKETRGLSYHQRPALNMLKARARFRECLSDEKYTRTGKASAPPTNALLSNLSQAPLNNTRVGPGSRVQSLTAIFDTGPELTSRSMRSNKSSTGISSCAANSGDISTMISIRCIRMTEFICLSLLTWPTAKRPSALPVWRRPGGGRRREIVQPARAGRAADNTGGLFPFRKREGSALGVSLKRQ